MQLHQRKKILKLLPLFLILLTIFNTNQFSKALEPTVLAVSHQPITVEYQTNVSITITFEDDTNITEIKIQYCSLEPVYACHVAKPNMTRVSENTWVGSFVVLEETGKIGYEILIYHTDGLTIAPNSINYLGHTNIAEPFPDMFYFSIDLVTPTENTPLNYGGPIIGFVFLVLISLRKRLKK